MVTWTGWRCGSPVLSVQATLDMEVRHDCTRERERGPRGPYQRKKGRRSGGFELAVMNGGARRGANSDSDEGNLRRRWKRWSPVGALLPFYRGEGMGGSESRKGRQWSVVAPSWLLVTEGRRHRGKTKGHGGDGVVGCFGKGKRRR
jgi:hypothetical protein